MKIKSRFKGGLPILFTSVTGNGNEGHGGHFGEFAQAPRQLIAIHLRQADVDERNVWAKLASELKRSRRIWCNHHFMAEKFGEFCYRCRRIRIVVDVKTRRETDAAAEGC